MDVSCTSQPDTGLGARARGLDLQKGTKDYLEMLRSGEEMILSGNAQGAGVPWVEGLANGRVGENLARGEYSLSLLSFSFLLSCSIFLQHRISTHLSFSYCNKILFLIML